MPDEREAARNYKLAADRGDAAAQSYLGFCYAEGRGVLQDDREAARYYKLAADQGSKEAQYDLGRSYMTGRGGLPRDDREAARYFKLSADQGIAQAQHNLRYLLRKRPRSASRRSRSGALFQSLR